jgi:hypothetical protein
MAYAAVCPGLTATLDGEEFRVKLDIRKSKALDVLPAGKGLATVTCIFPPDAISAASMAARSSVLLT